MREWITWRKVKDFVCIGCSSGKRHDRGRDGRVSRDDRKSRVKFRIEYYLLRELIGFSKKL